MKHEEFKHNIIKLGICNTTYYPIEGQYVLCMNINNQPARFVYDEERIKELSWEKFMCILDDDMFLVANRRVHNEH